MLEKDVYQNLDCTSYLLYVSFVFNRLKNLNIKKIKIAFTSTCSSVHLSRVTDLTLLMWVPSDLCSPPQRIQRKTPMFQDAQRVPNNMKHKLMILQLDYLFVHSLRNIYYFQFSVNPTEFVRSSWKGRHFDSCQSRARVFRSSFVMFKK